MAEKMRVHILAKELSVPSKVIVEKCNAEGINSVKNHMSTLSAGLHATIREWFSEGSHDTVVETSKRVDLGKVRKKRKTTKLKEQAGAASGDEGVGSGDTAVAVAEGSPLETVVTGADVDSLVADASPGSDTFQNSQVSSEAVIEPVAAVDIPVAEIVIPTDQEAGGTATTVVDPTVDPSPEAPPQSPAEASVPISPAGPQNVPAKAKLQGPRVVRFEAPDRDIRRPRPTSTSAPSAPIARPEDPSRSPDRSASRRKGRVNPRRTAGRTAESGDRLAEWRDRDLAERRERLAGATGRRIRRRATQSGGGREAAVPAEKTAVTVNEPVRMKEFCSTTGLNFIECFKILRDEHDLIANVNMALPTETAQLLALHFGIELTVIPLKSQLDLLQEEVAARERKNLQPRSPVVTMLGHVDHGKTSLLDAIRNTKVASSEDGGITQHIGAYHIETSHGPVTFLDTPGHKAFTAMRARGAQLTDVVVLVIAADDGLMPQTIEAINHAKSAGVPIVVALNKIDLGDQNKVRIFTQLSEHELTPSGDWGGEVDVIETSATTGQGVQTLVDHLADLSSLLELRGDLDVPAVAAVIEAETKSGVGPVARVLVQEGTLKIGDVVVCGPASGKVRALLDDNGRRIKSALPSIPVEVWGLDAVPSAGDRLYVVETLQRAKDIAVETKRNRLERARIRSRKVRSLEDLVSQRNSDIVPELNIIIKADVDGSVTALKQSLGEIPSDDVRLSVRHAGVGMVTDSDVLLAATCNGLIISFRVDAPVAVRRLAEAQGVEIRSYRVIYDACDDVKKALEGLLVPDEVIESRASVEVRDSFHFGKKLGVVAGGYVTDGVVNRSHLARVLRDGVVVREGCTFASLRRFKDDVREVRAGLECGIKLEGFDDIHVGDVIECYEVIKIARTL